MPRSPIVLFTLFALFTSPASFAQTDLLSLYKHLHANPELSFQERETAAIVARELAQAGFEVSAGVGGAGMRGALEKQGAVLNPRVGPYGVVAMLRNGDGPTLMLRTDMDGLPVAEQTGLKYASQAQGIELTGQEVSVMHACGHDTHMAVVIGAARELAARRGEWQGTLLVIGQPAEERGAGARLMLGRKMEIYASMVEYLDDQVGRVFDYLKEIDEYDNTVVIFMSDNGAEGNDLLAMVAGQAGTMGFLHAAANFPQMGHNYLGRKGTFAEVGPAWAQVSSTPFRLYKGMLTEGGVRSPLIVSGPGVKGVGELNKKAVLHVMDVAPTLLELAGIEQPGPTYKGREAATMQGKSWVDMLSGTKQSPRGESDWLGWEMFGNRAIRKGDWKITRLYKPYGTFDWQLFNLAEDLGEQYDLSDRFPEKKVELVALWDEYVKTNGVINGDRSILEGHRRHFPDPVQEFDSYPPVRGMEQIPHNQLLELMSK